MGHEMKSIFDKTFQYTPSNRTDIRRTFARIREQIAARQPMARTLADATNKVAAQRLHSASTPKCG